MQKHVRDKLIQIVVECYSLKWTTIRIKEVLIENGKLTPEMADQIEEAGRRQYNKLKRTANAHIASGSFLIVVSILIAIATAGTGIIVVTIGLLAIGIGEFFWGLQLRKSL